MNYEKQGEDFLSKTGTKFSVEFVGSDFYFDGDKEKRDIYRVTLERNGKKFSFRFGQSILYSRTHRDKVLADLDRIGERTYCSTKRKTAMEGVKAPTAYSVLASLTKSSPGSIDDFASEYGYVGEKPSTINKHYSAVVEEWGGVERLFGDVLDLLSEIS